MKTDKILIVFVLGSLITVACSTTSTLSDVPKALEGIGFPAGFKPTKDYESTESEWIGYAYSSGPDSAYAARTAHTLASQRAIIAMDRELEAIRKDRVKQDPALATQLDSPAFLLALRRFSSEQGNRMLVASATGDASTSGDSSASTSGATSTNTSGATSATPYGDAWVGYATIRIEKTQIREKLSEYAELSEVMLASPLVASW